MDHYEEFVEENIGLENGVDPSTFEEFLEPEEYVDHRHLFATDQIFNSKPELVNWAKETAIKVNTYLIVTRYLRSRTSDRRPYVTLGCERGGANKLKKKPIVDDEEEEVQAAKLTEEQLIQIEQFRKSHVLPRNILRFFREQNVASTLMLAQKIYNVVAKIKKNRMQGRNTIEEVFCLSAIQDYTVFYRNCEDSNMYNMPLLEVVGMTPTGKNFTVASAFMRNKQATTYRWVFQQIKHLYFSNTMST
ncbi:hypothetical protein M9H77_19329 [Catharanthus roseus]|uniref:Uncharacterized protein n=1 Tax=Catharanthus roseus TaxID=4058 RepID=A0ACC0BA01_CATRO|nr:hypothetical protein M9H77_19329 [Catharanthus roseus]